MSRERLIHWQQTRDRVEAEPKPRLTLTSAQRELMAIVIDAARGERRLDNRQSEPASLARIDGQGRVLDWLLHALRVSDAKRITFVGGYHIEKVIEQYPELQYRFLSGWKERGEVEALRMAGRPGRAVDCVIARATSLCVPEAVEQLRRDDEAISLGLYAAPEGRAAWVGLIHVPSARVSEVFEAADRLVQQHPSAGLADLVALLEGRGTPMRRVRVDFLAAPMEDASAVAEIAFRGKARTLEQIAPLLKSAVVPQSLRFPAASWRHDPTVHIEAVRATFGRASVVVRSSAASEDALTASLAGRFQSVLNVSADDAGAVRLAVDRVIESYQQRDRIPHAGDEVIVQRQVENLSVCGVLLTRDVSTGAPYSVVHVDRLASHKAGGMAPDRVTAGVTLGNGVHYVLRGHESDAVDDVEVQAALQLARELEQLTCRDALDIEFGITTAGSMNLLQVRPIALRARAQRLDEDLHRECEMVQSHVSAMMRKHPILLGETTMFSAMADWNPAEMIGPAPKPLALSLYQRLIGSRAWSQARAELGYRNVEPVPLIHSFCGRPFVDVRASLNSLVPAAIPEPLAARIVDAGLESLRRDPTAHDKIEFEIAHSCATLDVEHDHERLRAAGLDAKAIAKVYSAMVSVTQRMLRASNAAGTHRREALCELGRLLTALRSAEGCTLHERAARLQLVLSECERIGVRPFAVLARKAFVAMCMLRSLKRLGALSAGDYDLLLRSIPTVATELDRDISLLKRGKITLEAMKATYGHIRPNSYDITSQSYGASWSQYFGGHEPWGVDRAPADVTVARRVLDNARGAIERVIVASGIDVSVETLAAFLIQSIQGRERGKFEFMRAVHDVIELAAAIGAELGFERSDVAMMPISAIESLAIASPSGAVEMEWGRMIEFNRKRWALTSAIRLPGLIRSPREVLAFQVETIRPTYVSQSRVSGPIVLADQQFDVGSREAQGLRGAIVVLQAADPGFDWLFSKGIAGLITAWGGAGSHMTIRAAEFGLPAAIGCGELMYDSLKKANRVELDCGVQMIRVLS